MRAGTIRARAELLRDLHAVDRAGARRFIATSISDVNGERRRYYTTKAGDLYGWVGQGAETRPASSS